MFGFNGVSSVVLVGKGLVAAKTMVNTALSGALGGVASTAVRLFTHGYIDPLAANNGILSGLVAIVASCAYVQPEMAIVIGAVSGVLYQASSHIVLRLRVDDVVDAVSVHLTGKPCSVFSPAWHIHKCLI